ncbi:MULTISPECIES: SDR family NAD(P)-dependent oxidoreductase [unclassified Sinorhizobium]|uniref:SDR family NAD(P)-dependent oxidoreductase n=1 Tax=unclassified Sinorhizobium TaxID=2613772 RepID=UPI0024C452BA|nr:MULTISPECIES: SDR family NAD(P)-dependent oxidoreductase [unclassified Sinorhizobium]MDK1373699.1 SDR family NAD(P)-dependent oxidoreductase [Sinorhizobium sp. 6-70]MDK1477739.1 SDR family NAD(P)-dependent oxidoreductase [Sinorhizobium sp. 6-117]
MHSQHSIATRFGIASTASEVVTGLDLNGTTAVITGGYSGLGLEATRALAGAGAAVIVPARDRLKAERNLADLPNVSIVDLDLTDSGQIAAFGAGLVASGRPVSMLINSAGVMATPLWRNAEGHEGQFAINHLGHFRLTAAVWPALVRANGARVVSVSSRAHQAGGIDFEDIHFLRRAYDSVLAYGQAKTANALFAVELDRRGRDVGVRAFSLHPGQILTDIVRHLTPEHLARFDAYDELGNLRIDPANGRKTPEQGAATMVWAAVSSELDGLGGYYLEDFDVAQLYSGELGSKGVASWAIDPDVARRLWDVSVSMTGAFA